MYLHIISFIFRSVKLKILYLEIKLKSWVWYYLFFKIFFFRMKINIAEDEKRWLIDPVEGQNQFMTTLTTLMITAIQIFSPALEIHRQVNHEDNWRYNIMHKKPIFLLDGKKIWNVDYTGKKSRVSLAQIISYA